MVLPVVLCAFCYLGDLIGNPTVRLAMYRRGGLFAGCLTQTEVEHNNLRAALAWAIGGGNAEVGLRLAATLADFWRMRGYESEGRTWLEQALAGSSSAAPAIRATALSGLEGYVFILGDTARGIA